jgi:hypothetical protein
MNESEILDMLQAHLVKQFPKKCNTCGRIYVSLADYLRNTEHVGKPISYDADRGMWQPSKPVGTFSMANCSCGSTLNISSKGMNLITLWRMMNWARHETHKRGITVRDLLDDLRRKIDARVLSGQ